MRTITVAETIENQLPPRPVALQPFTSRSGTHDDEAMTRLENNEAIAIGGLSLIGDAGHMVCVIGLIKLVASENGENSLCGWSLHLNHPNVKFRQLRFFDTNVDGGDDIELPLPNCMVYFSSSIDSTIVEETADADTLQAIAHFIVPFVSDAGPPKGIDWPA